MNRDRMKILKGCANRTWRGFIRKTWGWSYYSLLSGLENQQAKKNTNPTTTKHPCGQIWHLHTYGSINLYRWKNLPECSTFDNKKKCYVRECKWSAICQGHIHAQKETNLYVPKNKIRMNSPWWWKWGRALVALSRLLGTLLCFAAENGANAFCP